MVDPSLFDGGASSLSSIFANKLIDDDRQPIVAFSVPGLDGRYGLFSLNLEFIFQSYMISLVLSIIQSIFAILIYYAIVKRRGTATSFLLGYGILIPASFQIAYEVIEILDIHNKDMKIIPSMMTTVLLCRTMEAMHNTSPPVVESSIWNYVLYTQTMVHYFWDEKMQRVRSVTLKEVLSGMLRLLGMMLTQAVIVSPLVMYDFRVFDSPVPLDSFKISIDLLHPKHLANCYLLVVSYYIVVNYGLNCATIGENAKGLSTKPVFASPLFQSQSPSDFWGKRWNLTVHRNLKSGLFLPLRKMGLSSEIAMFLTFAASGLLHDFYTSLVFYKHKRHSMPEESGFGFVPIHSKMLAFFAYNYLLMVLERVVGRHIPKLWYNWMPRPLLSTFVVAMCLPVSHWFTSQWVVGGYFHDKMIGHVMIAKIEE